MRETRQNHVYVLNYVLEVRVFKESRIIGFVIEHRVNETRIVMHVVCQTRVDYFQHHAHQLFDNGQILQLEMSIR